MSIVLANMFIQQEILYHLLLKDTNIFTINYSSE